MYKGYKHTAAEVQAVTSAGPETSGEWTEPPPAASYEAPKPKGTIIPFVEFSDDHIRDAVQDLRTAMKGAGTDEHTIIRVLTSHSNKQRQQLASAFKTSYGRDLVEDLESELSGAFRTCVKALMVPAKNYDAVCARAAMDGAGTNDKWLIELLCPRTAEEQSHLEKTYNERYPDRDLKKDVESETSGVYQKILLSSSTGGRDSPEKVNEERAKKDAKELYSAGEGRLGTDEEKFNEIFAVRSWPHLKLVAEEYDALSGRELEESVDREFSFNSKRAFSAIVQYAVDPEKYFTKRVYSTLKGRDQSAESLIRIFVSHSETDLALIRQRYQALFKSSLDSDVSKQFSGDFKKLLLKILNPKANLA